MKVDYGSLEFWDTQDEISVFEFICLLCDYRPASKDELEYPPDWLITCKSILDGIGEGTFKAWYRKDGVPEDFPSHLRDNPVAYSRYDTVPIYITYFRRVDFKDISRQLGRKPLAFFPDQRDGRQLKEMWPSPSAEVPMEKKPEPVPPALQTKAKPKKPKLKTKKRKAKRKETKPQPKPKPTKAKKVVVEPKKSPPAPSTGKGKIKILCKEIQSITRIAIREKISISTPQIAKLPEVKMAIAEHKKSGGPEVSDKTIQNWIRSERAGLGNRLKRGRPPKKKTSKKLA